MKKGIWFLCACFLPSLVWSQSAQELMQQSQKAYFYGGRDFRARVVMKLIDKQGQERVREMTLLRRNSGAAGGEQKYFVYFSSPPDVREMAFMTYKYPQREDDRWIYLPALKMVKRIAAQDKNSSFAGSDFTYEDVSGRDVEEDVHELLSSEKLDGRDCQVVKSTPRQAGSVYGYKLTWIEQGSHLPLKEMLYDSKGEAFKIFTADKVEQVGGRPTVTKRTMKNLQTGHRTEVVYTSAEYDLGLDDSLFAERFLRQPMRKWLQ